MSAAFGKILGILVGRAIANASTGALGVAVGLACAAVLVVRAWARTSEWRAEVQRAQREAAQRQSGPV
jgi:hypothetical protein